MPIVTGRLVSWIWPATRHFSIICRKKPKRESRRLLSIVLPTSISFHACHEFSSKGSVVNGTSKNSGGVSRAGDGRELLSADHGSEAGPMDRRVCTACGDCDPSRNQLYK